MNDYSKIEPEFRGKKADLKLVVSYLAGLQDGGLDPNDRGNFPAAPTWLYGSLERLMVLSADLVIRMGKYNGEPDFAEDPFAVRGVWHCAYICLDFHLRRTFDEMNGYSEWSGSLGTGDWSFHMCLRAMRTIFGDTYFPSQVQYTEEEIKKLDELVKAKEAEEAMWREIDNIQGPEEPLPNFD